MVKAFVFMDFATPGDPTATITKIEQISPDIQEVAVIYGPTDAIAIIASEDLASLNAITLQIRQIPGITRTDTRIVAL